MRPERGLIDGVCGVAGVDPEEDNDSIDTGEADECAEGEDAVQRELVLPGALEIPNHGDGECKDDEVNEDVEDLVDDEELVGVEAVAVDALIPVAAERATLEGTCEEDAGSPEGDEGV